MYSDSSVYIYMYVYMYLCMYVFSFCLFFSAVILYETFVKKKKRMFYTGHCYLIYWLLNIYLEVVSNYV